MRNALALVCGAVGALLLIWWLALTVLAIKGLLFHRHEYREGSANPPSQPPPEYQPPDTVTKGCLWAILVAFWPMALAEAFDEWIRKREAKNRLPNS